jgi:hypothetical protein
VGERLRPGPGAPLDREFLRQSLARELEPTGARVLIDDLQVAQLVQEHVVEQEAANGERRPLPARPRTKLLGGLAHAKGLCQPRAWRQSTQSNFAPAAVDIAEHTRASAAVVEVDHAQPPP